MDNNLLTFGEIFTLVCEGAEIARKEWVDSDTHDVVYVKYKQTGVPRLKLRQNDGTNVAWVPNEEELFAFDWYVLRQHT